MILSKSKTTKQISKQTTYKINTYVENPKQNTQLRPTKTHVSQTETWMPSCDNSIVYSHPNCQKGYTKSYCFLHDIFLISCFFSTAV